MDFGIPYLVCAGIVVFAAFAIPWWIHNWHATPTEKQLDGEIGYAAIALMFFLIHSHESRRARQPMLHLIFYPYPSIIPWFQDLQRLHDYCAEQVPQLNQTPCTP